MSWEMHASIIGTKAEDWSKKILEASGLAGDFSAATCEQHTIIPHAHDHSARPSALLHSFSSFPCRQQMWKSTERSCKAYIHRCRRGLARCRWCASYARRASHAPSLPRPSALHLRRRWCIIPRSCAGCLRSSAATRWRRASQHPTSFSRRVDASVCLADGREFSTCARNVASHMLASCTRAALTTPFCALFSARPRRLRPGAMHCLRRCTGWRRRRACCWVPRRGAARRTHAGQRAQVRCAAAALAFGRGHRRIRRCRDHSCGALLPRCARPQALPPGRVTRQEPRAVLTQFLAAHRFITCGCELTFE